MPVHCELFSLPYQSDPSLYFDCIRSAPGAILLDSGRPTADRGRFDILSAWPVETFQPAQGETGTAFFSRMRDRLAALGKAVFPHGCDLPFAGGLLGYLAYDFGRRLETLSSGNQDELHLPDAGFGLHDWALITDHQQRSTQLVFHPHCTADQRQQLIERFQQVPLAADAPLFALESPFAPTTKRQRYCEAIDRIHHYIRAGDCYQVNYTQRFQTRYQGDPWAAYQALRHACPTPFSGYMNLGGDDAILSLSPERFLSLRQGQIEARPIKGTRPRGDTRANDKAQAAALCNSAKDRAENLMIVDLLRNDIGRVSRVGSVHVPELFSLESYPNVHHLVSSIRAELADDLDAFDLLAASFPGGSITGAPKIRAMQIIDELEPHQRSLYCGSLLYVDTRGNLDSSITIRSLLAKDGRLSCWAGGGIVMDSDWQEEYQESLDKVGVLLRTLESRFLRLGRPSAYPSTPSSSS